MDTGDASRDSDYVIFRERKLVPIIPVLNGMKRFSFLLETCQPGSVPDHHLLAAILDLVSTHTEFMKNSVFLYLFCNFSVTATCASGGQSFNSARVRIFCAQSEQRTVANVDEIEFSNVSALHATPSSRSSYRNAEDTHSSTVSWEALLPMG